MTQDQLRTALSEAFRHVLAAAIATEDNIAIQQEVVAYAMSAVALQRRGQIAAADPNAAARTERRQAARDAFATSVGKLMNYLERLVARGDADAEALLTSFDAALPGIRDFRNMIEHEDEYLVGEGRRQDKYVVRTPAVGAFPAGMVAGSPGATTIFVQVAPDGTTASKMFLGGGHVDLGVARPALAAMRLGIVALRAKRGV